MPRLFLAFCSFYGIFLIIKGGVYLRIAICEDTDNDRIRLSDAIKDWANTRNVKIEILCYPNAEAFIFIWPNISFDIIFIDIELGKMTGVELAEYIRHTDKNILIVFVTNYQQYVFNGYDVNALHYLIKPLSQTRFIPIMDKAYLYWRDNKKDTLLVSNGSGQIKLPLGSIFYIEVFSHTAEIHTDVEVFKMRKSVTEFEKLLPAHFKRCYRSIIKLCNCYNILKLSPNYEVNKMSLC